ncbi:MAG: hypothetical protein OHK0046_14240 [Anaerolineae bacterium]
MSVLPSRGSGIVPNLVVAQRVIDKMTAAARQYLEDETGEAMIGLLTPGPLGDGVPTIYVLDTISPEANAPDHEVIRERYTFQQGDEGHYEIFTWLIENWEVQRELYRQQGQTRWNHPLRHLGDWHKQPGFMIAPSGGDLATALEQLDDESLELDFLLAPILTMGHPTTTGSGHNTNYLALPGGIRVDFWYINPTDRIFQPIMPVVYPDEQLPALVEYPWYLSDEQRATMEFKRFSQNQMFYSILPWNTDSSLPLEICVAAARMGGRKVYLLITRPDYPKTAPEIRVAPYIAMKPEEDIYDVFGQWWDQSEPVTPPPDWTWTEDKHLIDLVLHIEKHLGLAPNDGLAPDDGLTPDETDKSQEDVP